MDIDERINQAIALCNQKEYEQAKIILESVLKENPNFYPANLGMVRALTEDYSKDNVQEDFEYYFQKALKFSPPEERKSLVKAYNTYVNNLEIADKMGAITNKNSFKKSWRSNINVFIISLCLIMGIFLIIYEQYLAGAVLIGIALIIAMIWYFIHSFKK